MVAEGHDLGPHSADHPLYCDWSNREKSLVTKDEFTADLRKNLAAIRDAGAPTPTFFLPPYEWYNGQHAQWSAELGLTLVNFTPGSGSNRDYAREDDKHFVPAKQIHDDILSYERKELLGLRGSLLLLHLGSGRKDPVHPYVGPLCDELAKRGYQFVSLGKFLENTAPASR